jgi:calcium-binding protein CML
MSQREMFELTRELEFRRRQIVKLEQELKDRDDRILDLELQQDRVREADRQFQATKENMEQTVMSRVKTAIDSEKERFRKLVDDLTQSNESLKRERESLLVDRKVLDDKNAEISFLTSKLKEIAEHSGMTESMKDFQKDRNLNEALRKELETANHHWTSLSKQMEDILAENRVLREMAGVPENYGFDLNEIRLVEKQKIEEYRGRITRLEEEVEELEKERTQLRYKIRNLSTLYGEKGLRFHQLTAEQMKLVDEFALNLREGRIEIPVSDKTKELMLEVERLKAQIQILEANSFGRKVEAGVSDEILEEIRKENRELKELLMKLFTGAAPTSEEKNTIQRHALSLPPVPIQDSEGDFKEGFSYRFSSKVPIPEIWTGDSKRDMSAMQLQIIELLELITRRDEEDKMTSMELDEFRNKLREVLLVQQELYKDYSKELLKWQEDRKHFEENYEQALQELREARAQVAVYQDMAKTIQSSNSSQERSKLVEQTTRIALLEVNLLRLSRKYECLLSEEKDLRQAYHSFEAEHAEKDVIVQRTMGKLKEWRVSATYQLKFLFKQLRNSISIDKYEQLEFHLDLLREKQAEWVYREAQLYSRISKLENADRENYELGEKLRKQDDLKIELESELDLVSRRLEDLDPLFKLERAVFRKIVELLKARLISAETAFGLFDKNKDGRISRDEFRSALNNMGIKLNGAELDSVIRSVDTDNDGGIKYKEFIKKLQVYGANCVSEEQQILNSVYENIKKLGYSLDEVFQIFDRDSDGVINRQDLMDSFNNFGLGLSASDIQKIMKLIDSNRDGAIEMNEFRRVFERELEIKDQTKGFKLNWKDELFNKINNAVKTYGLDLSEAFASFDKNHDGRISKSEFIDVFREMGVSLTKDQTDELWNSMNSDRDGFISYVEFVSQFRSSNREAETQAIIEEANRASRIDTTSFSKDKNRQALLEAREQAAQLKADRYESRMKSLESNLSESEKRISMLELQNLELLRKYQLVREEEAEIRVKLVNCISKAEGENLKQNNEKLQKELAEARAAMNTYKALVGVSSDHVRALRLTIERRKDEIENFQIAIRELQAESQEAATLGKLYHQVMISRWAEASANRKFDCIQNETRVLRNENFKLESLVMDNEKIINDLQTVLTEKIAAYEFRVKELKLMADHNISMERANELMAQIREYGEKKSELEDFNRKLRSELMRIEGKVEEAKIMKKSAEEIFGLIKNGSSDELSDKLVEMAERMSGLRLAELKSKREAAQSKEKEEYLSRLRLQDQDNIRALEQEVAKMETMMAKKEEIWRKKDDERQKMLLNPKFQINQDIPKFPAAELKKREEDLKLLQEQLRQAENTLQIKNEQIEQLTKIRTESRQEAPVRESQDFRLPDQDTRNSQLAQIASKNIKTINEMLENKNNELSRKEEHIEELKRKILIMQQEFSKEKLLWGNERAKLQDGVKEFKTDVAVTRTRTVHVKNPELESLLQQRDKEIENLKGLLKNSEGNKAGNEKRIKELRNELEKIAYELNIERSKHSDDKFRKEMDHMRKMMKAKDEELARLKNALQNLKRDLLSGT